MKILTALLWLLCLVAPQIGATTYNIGPGRTYPDGNAFDASVGWHSLQAGDIVRIHWRAEPYREFILISGRGTSTQPIKLQGVLGPDGRRPVIDGHNAVQSPNLRYQDMGILEDDIANGTDNYYVGGLYSLGLVTVARSADMDWLDTPSYVTIENLEIRNANEDNTFTPHYAEQYPDYGPIPRPFGSFAAGLRVQRGEHLTVKNCVIHHNGNGLFVNSQAWENSPTDIDDLTSKYILVAGNYIHDNGRVGFEGQHNVYVEAVGATFEYNRIGRVLPGSHGSLLKDRSSNTVVRYNWFEGGGAGHLLDLVEAENGAPIIVKAPNYHLTRVYGNVFINPPDGASSLVHYGGDHGDYSIYRRGVLRFFNNTLINRADQVPDRWRSHVFLLPLTELTGTADMDEKVKATNNILYNTAATPGAAPSEFYLITSDGKVRGDFVNNWISAPYIDGFSGHWNGTDYDPFIGTVTHVNTLNNADNNPGFLQYAKQNYHLAGGAQSVNAGAAITGANRQYVKHQTSELRVALGATDIGAFEFPGCNPPKNFSVSALTADSASFTWLAVPGATQYRLYWKKQTKQQWSAPHYTTGTSDTVTGLLPKTLYDARLQAKCANERWSAFRELSFTTPE
jgi:hypothetical protein